MKVLYIQKKNFTQFLINNYKEAQKSDLIVFAPGCFEVIDIENEINRNSQQLINVCHFSREIKATIIIFCPIILNKNKNITNAALVIGNGKLIGICDVIDTTKCDSVASINVYEIAGNRICVLVENNAKIVEFWQIALIYNCNLIVSGVNTSCRAITSLARFYLDEFNVNTIVSSKNKVEVFSKNKNVEQKKNLSLISFKKFNVKKVPKFYKYIYKTIYENFN